MIFSIRPKFGRVKRQIGNGLNNLFGRLTRPLTQGLNNVDVTRFVQPAAAPNPCGTNEETLPCDNTTPFRKFSGFCNNVRNPTFGKTLTSFNRLLPAGYDDGIARPRWRSVNGQPLPSPRLISVVVHQDVSNVHRRYTMLMTMFGQFIDHDVTLTPISRGFQVTRVSLILFYVSKSTVMLIMLLDQLKLDLVTYSMTR